MRLPIFTSFVVFVVLPSVGALVYRTKTQFLAFYPQFGYVFEGLRDGKCRPQYHIFLYATEQNQTIDLDNGADEHSVFTQPLIQCLLKNTSDYIKSSLQSAQVILGLTPTILALLGSSVEENSLLAVIGRRPMLALLLAMASPLVYTSRAFEYRNPREILRDRDGRYVPSMNRNLRRFVVAAEYIVRIVSLGNIVHVNYQLGVQTICTLASNLVTLPTYWALLAIGIHFLGVILLCIRAKRQKTPETQVGEPVGWWSRGVKWFLNKLRLVVSNELCTTFPPEVVRVKWRNERKWFLVTAWLLSICTVMHIIFGTLIFSSMNFIGARDALSILGRYMVSVLSCRVVLMYELSVLRNLYTGGLQQDREGHAWCEHLEECKDCGGQRPAGKDDVIEVVSSLGGDLSVLGKSTSRFICSAA